MLALAAGLAGVMLHVGLRPLWNRWYRRLRCDVPAAGVQAVEYGRRLLAAARCGYSVEVEPMRFGGECDHSRRRLLLPPAAWADRLDAVLLVAHEVGHAVLDRGLAVRLGSGLGPLGVALVWMGAVIVAGRLRMPLLALLAVAGSVFLAGDALVREVRACLFARDCVCRDFPEPACRAWARAETRLEIWHMVQVTVALALVFSSAAGLLYCVGRG